MAAQTVTESYLMGITEGRSYLRRFAPDVAEMREVLANVESTLRRFPGGGEVAQMLRGERDFWRGQLKRAR